MGRTPSDAEKFGPSGKPSLSRKRSSGLGFDIKPSTVEKNLRKRLFDEIVAKGSHSGVFGFRLAKDVAPLRALVAKLSQELTALQSDTHSWLSAQSQGLDLDFVDLPRYMPVRVYLSKASKAQEEKVLKAVKALLDGVNFEIAKASPPKRASFFQHFVTRSKEACSKAEVAERLRKVERAIEVQALGKAQAEIDEKEATAAATLVAALANTPNAAVQAGSLLLVKVTAEGRGATIQARTLTQREMIQLENNQSWLTSPSDILYKLSVSCRDDVQTMDGSKGLVKQPRKKANGSMPRWPKLDPSISTTPKPRSRTKSKPKTARSVLEE